MTWARVIDLREAFDKYDGHPFFTVTDFARRIEHEMIKMERFWDQAYDSDFETIRLEFALMVRNEEVTEEKVDELLYRLYLWGRRDYDPQTRVCWIRVI